MKVPRIFGPSALHLTAYFPASRREAFASVRRCNQQTQLPRYSRYSRLS